MEHYQTAGRLTLLWKLLNQSFHHEVLIVTVRAPFSGDGIGRMDTVQSDGESEQAEEVHFFHLYSVSTTYYFADNEGP